MYAVEFERLGRVIFSIVPVPSEYRDEIRDAMGGRLRSGVNLDVPEDYSEWPDGVRAPEQVLCVEEGRPDSFRIFPYATDAPPQRFRVDGRNWNTIGSTTGWHVFMDSLRNLNRIAAEARGDDPPTEEAAEGPDSPRNRNGH